MHRQLRDADQYEMPVGPRGGGVACRLGLTVLSLLPDFRGVRGQRKYRDHYRRVRCASRVCSPRRGQLMG
jgi:hypothetical protein